MAPTPRELADDPGGMDESRNYLAEGLSLLVPASLARRAVTISVSVADREHVVGAPVPFTVTIRNRLPVPVSLHTPQPRLWGWAIDGEVEGSDETTYSGTGDGELALDGREVRRIDQEWSGRLRRTGSGPDDRTEWVLPEAGTHELSVFLATTPPRASDSVELTLRPASSP